MFQNSPTKLPQIEEKCSKKGEVSGKNRMEFSIPMGLFRRFLKIRVNLWWTKGKKVVHRYSDGYYILNNLMKHIINYSISQYSISFLPFDLDITGSKTLSQMFVAWSSMIESTDLSFLIIKMILNYNYLVNIG